MGIMSVKALIDTQNKRLSVAVSLLLALVALWLLVLIVLQIAQQPEESRSIVKRQAATLLVPRWNWFAAPGTVKARKEHGKLQQARVNAQLLGVMTAGDASIATMKFDGKPEAVYRIGDELGSGLKIKQIEPYRVIVEQNGGLREIPMKKAESLLLPESGPAARAVRESSQSGFNLANMFGAVPVRVENYESGWKLNNLSNELQGLTEIKDGDIVVEVGGQNVQSLLSDPSRWLSYRKRTSLPITVIRDGQEVVVNVNAASLSARILPKLGNGSVPE